jgi:hypothetical protein
VFFFGGWRCASWVTDLKSQTPGETNQRFLGRSDEELTLDVGLVRLVDCRGVGKVALLLGALLGQDVALEGVLALDFASSRQLKTLLGAGFGFHLWHGLRFLEWWVISSSD